MIELFARLTPMRWIVGIAALVAIAVSVWQLEAERRGVVIAPVPGTGTTPATVYRLKDAPPAPVVIVSHGFAGSRQLMQAWSLTLARAGYAAVAFDYEGHGRNPVPMSGDLDSPEGTALLLMAETRRVTDAALAQPWADGRVAILGHSMGSYIAVREAREDPRIAATIGVAAANDSITATEPPNLLMINGAWETRLAEAPLEALRLADPEAQLGDTVGDPATGTGRRALLAPDVEHIGVIWSPTALRETRAWLDATFGRTSGGPVVEIGGWIALLLVGIVALAWPLARMRGQTEAPRPAPLPRRRFLIVALLPAVAVPLILAPFRTQFLPVLVADYLAVHFALYGAMVLALLAWWGEIRWAGWREIGRILALAALVALYTIGVFGFAMDRYVTSFYPIPIRGLIIAAMAVGAVPYMLSDALMVEGGRVPAWRSLVSRGAFLVSLGIATALDFHRLFFLLLILPIILIFYLLFGTMGGWIGRATNRPAGVGLGLGLFLAWALGVTFPMFQAV
ncbi:dienelactone hydrolase family protein [Rhodovulum sulfidophilum]|uniref:dienelactone hydrolase family protein n=1 Tax=Rhodovulum sulfidophilum TaxID=35806 RepID=UPI001F1BFB51|nr:alpha/beta fold hydrolase [Rhodovulum sulfidophilum]MCE8440687.1 alpha/beta fold hydrolase [Rhodovulum sulfidophilum]MCE8468760.1 alpha/beta fold hydrolase [Rhodovulum sulfidophilum]